MTTSPVLTVGYRTTLEQALRLMQQNSAATAAVTDAAGKLVGLATSDTIAEMMTLAMLQKDGAGGAPLAWRSLPGGIGDLTDIQETTVLKRNRSWHTWTANRSSDTSALALEFHAWVPCAGAKRNTR